MHIQLMKTLFFSHRSLVGALLLLAVWCPGQAWAQVPQATDNSDSTKKASQRNFDLSVPASPAFTFLGTTPENVVRPTSPRQLAVAVNNAIDLKGVLQNGVAIDAAPFLATTTLAEYRGKGFKGRLKRFKANTQFSLGTTQSQEASTKSMKGAFGVHFTLANTDDPRRNDVLIKRYDTMMERVRALVDKTHPYDPSSDDESKAARAKAIEDAVTTAAKDFDKEASKDLRRNGEQHFIWTAAAALGGQSDSSTIRNVKYDGFGAWTSASYGIGKGHQLIAHARLRLDERVVAKTLLSDDAQDIQDSYFLGGRYRTSIGNLRTSLEGLYTITERTTATEEITDNGGLVSLVIEPRLSENLWLHLSLFSEFAKASGQNTFGFKTSFKWGLASE